jgi:hypothetical protein
MRYAECPTVSIDVVVHGSAEAVWQLVSDISLPTHFSSELAAVEWLGDDSSPRVGARFAGRSEHTAIGGWQTECVITACERPRLFEWCVGDPGHPSAIWRFTVTDAGLAPGSVRLEQWFQMGPARSGLNAAIDAMPDKEERIVARRLGEHRANMEANLAGIKSIVEGGAP